MRRRGVASLLLVLCTALLVAAAAQSRPAAGKTINIGGVFDKSGPTVVAQAPVLHAIEAYFKYTNDNGGVNGDKINFIEKDDSYSPAKTLEATKSLVNDENVVLVAGFGTSSAFSSILPVLTAAKVPGFMTQATVKDASDPFQPWIFEGNCNYSDQADLALSYEMTKLKLKTLKGKKVGVASIDSASGQEWTANLTRRVQGLGGTVVVQAMPAAIINADLQAQAFQQAKVDFILIGHAAPGGIALLKSMAKYGMEKTPVSGHFGVANENVFLQAPYEMSKNFAAINCVTPPGLAKTAKGKLATAMGKKYGYPDSEVSQANWSLGWTEGAVIVQGLKNAKGNYTGAAVRAGLEKVKTLDTGGLAPNVGFSAKCHMLIRQLRPYTYNYKTKSLQPIGSYTQWAKYNTNYYAAPGTCGK